jgi:hypothetical protein
MFALVDIIIFTITGGNRMCPVGAPVSEVDSYTLAREADVWVND